MTAVGLCSVNVGVVFYKLKYLCTLVLRPLSLSVPSNTGRENVILGAGWSRERRRVGLGQLVGGNGIKKSFVVFRVGAEVPRRLGPLVGFFPSSFLFVCFFNNPKFCCKVQPSMLQLYTWEKLMEGWVFLLSSLHWFHVSNRKITEKCLVLVMWQRPRKEKKKEREEEKGKKRAVTVVSLPADKMEGSSCQTEPQGGFFWEQSGIPWMGFEALVRSKPAVSRPV